jgi:hypothetical protein
MRRWSLLGLLALLLSGCAMANPWPDPPPRVPVHRTLLVIGDSLAGQQDFTLPDVLEQKGLDATVIDAHQNGSGLIGPVGDSPDALSYVKEQIMEHPQADTVLIQWAGACATCGTGTAPIYGSPAFFNAWRANAHAIIDYLHSEQVAVVWAQSPPLGVDTLTGASGSQITVDVDQALSLMDKTDLAPYAGTGVVDWYTALTDTQLNFQLKLFYDGAFHVVRADDFVHFTLDGATRASTWTARGLGQLWATLPPPPDVSIQGGPQPRLIEAGDPVTLAAAGGL